MAAAVGLFEDPGFEATSVAEIAAAMGVSRATFFRQVGTKEDAIFADHPPLLAELDASIEHRLGSAGADAWDVVGAASLEVFDHFTRDLPMARRRYRVVRQTPALREREIVTERRYEQIFDRALRRALPGVDSLRTVCFAAAITAAHNHELRALLRGSDEGAAPAERASGSDGSATQAVREARNRLRRAVGALRERLAPEVPQAPERGDAGAASPGAGPNGEVGSAVIVASFPAGADPEDVARRVREALG